MFVAVASVAARAAGAASKDVLVGTGERLNLGGQPVRFSVVAYSGANGEGATGRYLLTRTNADGSAVFHSGSVHCLAVAGNRANGRAIVDKSTAPDIVVGSGFGFQVTDNGKAYELGLFL
jgi:hypothetical protein